MSSASYALQAMQTRFSDQTAHKQLSIMYKNERERERERERILVNDGEKVHLLISLFGQSIIFLRGTISFNIYF